MLAIKTLHWSKKFKLYPLKDVLRSLESLILCSKSFLLFPTDIIRAIKPEQIIIHGDKDIDKTSAPNSSLMTKPLDNRASSSNGISFSFSE